MAHYAPSEKQLEWFDNKLKNDPDFAELHKDHWEKSLPMPPRYEDPDHYAPLISRRAWGALPARGAMTPIATKPVLYLRYTMVGKQECGSIEECSRLLRDLQIKSMDEGLADIPYNFLIGGKGIIYEGRGWEWEADREAKWDNWEGLHGKLKGKTIDVAYIGDFSLYSPANDLRNGAAMFFIHYSKMNLLDRMVQPIPYHKDPDNPRGFPEGYPDPSKFHRLDENMVNV